MSQHVGERLLDHGVRGPSASGDAAVYLDGGGERWQALTHHSKPPARTRSTRAGRSASPRPGAAGRTPLRPAAGPARPAAYRATPGSRHGWPPGCVGPPPGPSPARAAPLRPASRSPRAHVRRRRAGPGHPDPLLADHPSRARSGLAPVAQAGAAPHRAALSATCQGLPREGHPGVAAPPQVLNMPASSQTRALGLSAPSRWRTSRAATTSPPDRGAVRHDSAAAQVPTTRPPRRRPLGEPAGPGPHHSPPARHREPRCRSGAREVGSRASSPPSPGRPRCGAGSCCPASRPAPPRRPAIASQRRPILDMYLTLVRAAARAYDKDGQPPTQSA